MIPQKGQHVKCLLKNNVIVDGVVESWSDTQSILKSIDDNSISIIQNCNQDVMVIKIILKEPSQLKNELKTKFEQEYQKSSNDSLRLKNMAELKNLMNEQEKKIIADRIKNHHIGDARKVVYEHPEFFKKSSIK